MAAGIVIYGIEETSGDHSPAVRFRQELTHDFRADKHLDRCVFLDLSILDDRKVEISRLDTLRNRQRGHGGRALGLVIRLADRYGITLTLQACATYEPRLRKLLDQAALEAFYARRGFVTIFRFPVWMERRPLTSSSNQYEEYVPCLWNRFGPKLTIATAVTG